MRNKTLQKKFDGEELEGCNCIRIKLKEVETVLFQFWKVPSSE